MKSLPVIRAVVADPRLARDRTPAVSNDPPKPGMRSDVDVVHDDAFFHLRPPLDPHASADDRSPDVGVETQRSLSDHRVVDSRAHRSKSFALDISPGNSAEIGHAQGWLVTSGQSVKVAATGYRSIMAFPP